MNITSVCVIYLFRKNSNIFYAKRFLESYAKYASGIPHELVIAMKGFTDNNNILLEIISNLNLKINFLYLEDKGYDINTYYEISLNVPFEYVLFCNTYSVIKISDWLSKLYKPFIDVNCGIVGCSGSYESLLSGELHIKKISYFSKKNVFFRKILSKQYFFIKKRKFIFNLRSDSNLRKMFKEYKHILKKFTRSNLFDLSYANFPTFPNPHIRTNAFLIKRSLFLSLEIPEIKCKSDAYEFESGKNSMTKQIIKNGYYPLIVNSEGFFYKIENWHKSNTFRTMQNQQSIIDDNQNEIFNNLNLDEKRFAILTAWGDADKRNLKFFNLLNSNFKCEKLGNK